VPTVRVLFFANARDAAGCSQAMMKANTLSELLDEVITAYPSLAAIIPTTRIWINGDDPTAGSATLLNENDEVAVLPPVSGG